jgi:hypothetical protein
MNALYPGDTLQRPRLMTLLHTALAVGETRFARRLALSWLASYPGDLPVSLINARALLEEDHPQQAADILESLCQVDIEYLEAHELLALIQQRAGLQKDPNLACVIYALGGKYPSGESVPEWASCLRGARQAKLLGNLDRASDLIHRALPANPHCSLSAVTHLQVLAAAHSAEPSTKSAAGAGDFFALPSVSATMAIRNLAEAYHERWPSCSQITLLLAHSLIDCNEDDSAVALLHLAASQDVTGQIATRLWGVNHIYRPLWPDKLCITHDQQIPAAVAACLGWNQLPGAISNTTQPNGNGMPAGLGANSCVSTKDLNLKGRAVSHPSQRPDSKTTYATETLKSVQEELDKLASRLKQPNLAHMDGRFPIYVIFTTLSGLESQYGTVGADAVEVEMKRLVQASRSSKQWGAILFYADKGGFGVLPTKPTDPWGLKLALVDLDAALAKDGERIGAVLIVGGPQVVPFHNLPNPVDDADVDVPSDNPYATRDENYFIPEWPVGRLPGDAGNDPKPLINSLRAITNQRTKKIHHWPWYARWLHSIRNFFGLHIKENHPSLGYTAAIWRRASLAVFRPVGNGGSLLVSPPVESVKGEQWTPGSLGYFNLHGVVDAAEWFGQRDPTESNAGSDYPVVLRPSDVVNSGRSPKVIFTEACYGAHIYKRSIEEALALKFLDSGSQVFVGSTCVSYGSVTLPLIAADLLGRSFWKFIKEGLPAGEALRRAKVTLAREMHNRQGYLDGEDQKTLISFVLYGDPLAQPTGNRQRDAKSLLRSFTIPNRPCTVCDRNDSHCNPVTIPSETLAQVKSIVSQYLPGMSDAQLSLNIERAECHATGHACPTALSGAKASPVHLPKRQTVVLSKRIEQEEQFHNQYARLTLDEHGKLVKLAVSR